MCSILSLKSFPNIAFEMVPVVVRLTVKSFQGRLAITAKWSFLQVISGVMSLVLGLQVVSQAPQHLRSSKTHATCDGCFARQSVCLVISLHSGMFRAVCPLGFLKVNVKYWHMPALASHSTFCSRLFEFVRIMECVVWLSSLEAWVTASTSVVKLEVKAV